MTSHEWGRVDEDGTVFVRTADGERSVGPVPRGHARGGAGVLHRALRRARVRGPAARAADQVRRCSPRTRRPSRSRPSRPARRGQRGRRPRRRSLARLDALGPVIAAQREARKAERAQQRGRVATRRRRRSSPRPRSSPRQRLAQRRQPAARPPRRVEGAPPHRPGLRRRAVAPLLRRAHGVHPARKSHFAEQHEKREGARVVKERLAKEAEALATRPTGDRPPARTAS